MQKQLIALAVLGALAAPAFAADNSVTLYGRIDMGLESYDDGSLSRIYMQNFASRIGFKGEEDLGDGLKAVWQVEQKVSPDDASSSAFASRNSYIGLKNDFGTVLMGNYDMPLKQLDRNVGFMWNQTDVIEQIINGKAAKATGAIGVNFHTRQKNVIQYHSPSFSGLQLKAAYAPDENKGDTSVYNTTATAGSNRQVYGLSADYDAGMWSLGAAYESQQDAVAKGFDLSAVKLTGGVKLGDVTVGAAYSKLDNDQGAKVDTYALLASYKLGATTLKAAYGSSGESADNADNGADLFSLEADYSLSKRTTVYGYFAQYKTDTKTKNIVFPGGDNSVKSAAGTDPRVIGLGVRHNF